MAHERSHEPTVGLCSHCAFAAVVTSGRGSQFWMCGRARDDARFRKYPPLPVTHCAGFEEGTPVLR